MSLFVRRTPGRSERRANRTPRRSPRLFVTALEHRDAPAVFTVQNTNDSGAGSLRDALTQANATVAADTINFDPAFFSTPRVISLLTPLGPSALFPSIRQDVSIVGPGASLLTIQRDPGAATTFRLFYAGIDGKTGNVSFSGLTLTGGNAGAGAIGGGILTDENTTISD